jgi:hypothetical protein
MGPEFAHTDKGRGGKLTTEKEIQDEIRLALSDLGCLIFRNNSGIATYENGTKVRYGVGGPGGSDLIGIGPNGRIICIEVKSSKGRLTADQENFLRVVREHGGIAGCCRSAEEAIALVNHDTAPRTPNT